MDRFVFITDSHFMKNNIKSRTDDYPKALFKKLRWVFKYCKKKKIKNIIHGGDLLDNPYVSDYIAGKIARLFDESGLQLWYTIGNHDITGKNPDTYVNGKLHMFESYKWFHFIGDGVTKFENCVLHGIDYSKEDEESLNFDIPMESVGQYQDTIKIIVVHHMITGDKNSLVIKGRRRLISYTDVTTNADIVLCGHYHPGMKIKKALQLERPITFANPGSFGRTDSWASEHGCGPGLIDIRIKKGGKPKLKFVEIPHEKNVFKEAKEDKYNVDALVNDSRFVDMLNKFKSSGIANDEVSTILEALMDSTEELPFELDGEIADFILNKIDEVKNGTDRQ